MRGRVDRQQSMFVAFDLEQFVPADHPAGWLRLRTHSCHPCHRTAARRQVASPSPMCLYPPPCDPANPSDHPRRWVVHRRPNRTTLTRSTPRR